MDLRSQFHMLTRKHHLGVWPQDCYNTTWYLEFEKDALPLFNHGEEHDGSQCVCSLHFGDMEDAGDRHAIEDEEAEEGGYKHRAHLFSTYFVLSQSLTLVHQVQVTLFLMIFCLSKHVQRLGTISFYVCLKDLTAATATQEPIPLHIEHQCDIFPPDFD